MTFERTNVETRPRNWLPLPGEHEEVPQVEEDDLFTKGEIVVFYPHQGRGAIRVREGVEYDFDLHELDLVGPKGKSHYLKAGCRVGFDVARTSRGYRITQLKVY